MRILICGLGSVGRRHLRNLVSLGQEDLVLYRTGKSRLPGDELVGWPISDRLEAALKDWAPDAAVIANPTSLHLETARAAAEAGCHILLEKPISDRLDGLSALETSVVRKGLRVLVGYQFRFHPGLRAAKAILDDGSIGQPVSARAEWGEYLPSWHPWEDYRQAYSARADLGGGAVLTLSHPFDYLRWLFGEVESVTAQVGKGGQLEIDVDDVAEVIMGFDFRPAGLRSPGLLPAPGRSQARGHGHSGGPEVGQRDRRDDVVVGGGAGWNDFGAARRLRAQHAVCGRDQAFLGRGRRTGPAAMHAGRRRAGAQSRPRRPGVISRRTAHRNGHLMSDQDLRIRFDLTGKTAIITGGGGLLGRAHSGALGSRGGECGGGGHPAGPGRSRGRGGPAIRVRFDAGGGGRCHPARIRPSHG